MQATATHEYTAPSECGCSPAAPPAAARGASSGSWGSCDWSARRRLTGAGPAAWMRGALMRGRVGCPAPTNNPTMPGRLGPRMDALTTHANSLGCRCQRSARLLTWRGHNDARAGLPQPGGMGRSERAQRSRTLVIRGCCSCGRGGAKHRGCHDKCTPERHDSTQAIPGRRRKGTDCSSQSSMTIDYPL